MISVVLSYPNGRQENVLLAGVPRVGDHVRVAGSPVDSPSLVVESVLWLESKAAETAVIVIVRPHVNGPRA